MAIFNLIVGLSGSGKTTAAKEWASRFSNTTIISSDDIRQELWGDANDQQNPAKVFEVMFDRTVEAMKRGENVVYDATNLIAKTRKSTLLRLRRILGNDFQAVCTLVVCAISECKQRQSGRERKVSDEVIDRTVRQFQIPWYNEGWDSIYIISCGKMQNIDREHWRMLGEPHDNHHHSLSLEMHCAACEGEMRSLLNSEEWNERFDYRMKGVLEEAAYQHDLGKRKTKAFLDSKGNPTEEAHYYNHDNVGAYLWISGDEKNKWTKDEFLYIGLLIQYHMMPFFMRDAEDDYHTNFRNWCIKKGFERLYDAVCILHEADKAAH